MAALSELAPLVSMRKLEALLGESRHTLSELLGSADEFYSPFDMRRKGNTGKWRHIDNPTGPIKKVQTVIYERLLQSVVFPPTVLGSVKGKSIKDNARSHLQQKVIAKLDLRNCFPSISDRMVFAALKRVFGCSDKIAGLLTRLTTCNFHLPQGASTSAALANLVLLPLHDEMQRICREAGVVCTFYVDDIAISGTQATSVLPRIISLIKAYGFSLERRKIRIMRGRREALSLTGMILNRKPSVGRPRSAEIRGEILTAGSSPIVGRHQLESIRGKIAWVTTVAPDQGRALERLARKHLSVDGVPDAVTKRADFRPCACKIGKNRGKNSKQSTRAREPKAHASGHEPK
jgi:RNA-directed DNA polymerase